MIAWSLVTRKWIIQEDEGKNYGMDYSDSDSDADPDVVEGREIDEVRDKVHDQICEEVGGYGSS